MINNADLTFRVLELVNKLVDGTVDGFHIYSNDYSNFNVIKDGKKISVSISVEEVEKDA